MLGYPLDLATCFGKFGVAILLYFFGERARVFIEKRFNALTVLLAVGVVCGFLVLL